MQDTAYEKFLVSKDFKLPPKKHSLTQKAGWGKKKQTNKKPQQTTLYQDIFMFLHKVFSSK